MVIVPGIVLAVVNLGVPTGCDPAVMGEGAETNSISVVIVMVPASATNSSNSQVQTVF